jgi:hypothetical protein
MRHLDLPEIARLLSSDPPTCRHLAETCPVCGERLQQVEALMKRFQHWDPEVAVLEGLPAEGLFAAIMAAGQDGASWLAQVDAKAELQTWGVAWVALEQAREQLAEEASRPRARDLALLAARIAESLGQSYHPDSVADLKARAYAVAAAAEPQDGNLGMRLQRMAAALAALEKGSGEEAVARDVWDLFSQVIRPQETSR